MFIIELFSSLQSMLNMKIKAIEKVTIIFFILQTFATTVSYKFLFYSICVCYVTYDRTSHYKKTFKHVICSIISPMLLVLIEISYYCFVTFNNNNLYK